MASYRNDLLLGRTGKGTINLYDDQRCEGQLDRGRGCVGVGTAADKAIAARLGGHSYNFLTHEPDTVYLPNLRLRESATFRREC